MISSHEALQLLKRYWRVEKLQFLAHYKKIEPFKDKNPFGIFQPYTKDFPQLRYPTIEHYSYKRNVSLYTPHRKDLIDGAVYVIDMELQEDEYRIKHSNPFLLKLSHYTHYKSQSTPEIIDFDEVKKVIQEINQDYLSLNSPFQVINQANSVNLLATDIYSENKRFIYELIQNADDAALGDTTEVEIRILNQFVVIGHKGKPFTGRDIRGLCGVGLGSKTNDETKTGYKGIGFKSVFGQPAGLVYVQSKDLLFKFDRNYIERTAWKEEWGDQQQWELDHQAKFKSPWQLMPILVENTGNKEVDDLLKHKDFTVRTIIKIENARQMQSDLQEMLYDAHVLLFLRKVVTIHLYHGDNPILSIQKKTNGKRVQLYLNQQLQKSYYLFQRTVDVDAQTQALLQADIHTPDKIRHMKRSEFAIAVQLDEKEKAIQLLDKQHSPIYSYLPTSDLDYEFPFLVNGNFILDAGRQKIAKDHNWNGWLFKIIGNQVVELCSELAENGLYLENYFELLSKGMYTQTGKLFQQYNSGLEIGLRKIPFILNATGDLILLQEVCIDDLDLIKNKISTPGTIIEILQSNFGQEFERPNVLEKSPLTTVLKKLGAFSLSKKQAFIRTLVLSSSFGENITLNNNVAVLEFLRLLEQNDGSKKWYIEIINHPFVLNSDLELCTLQEICYPMDTIDEDPEFQNALMHAHIYEQVYATEDLKSWLDEMGVRAPGSLAYLEKEIIGKFPESIDESNYLKYTQFILDLHRNGSLSEEHYLGLQALPLMTENGFKKANMCLLGKNYHPDFDFTIFKNAKHYVSTVYCTSSDYPQHEWKSFFIKIGVAQDIEFKNNLIIHNNRLDENYVLDCCEFSKEGHSYPKLVNKIYSHNFTIQTFSFIDLLEDINEWELFWDKILRKYSVNYIGNTEHKSSNTSKIFISKNFKIDKFELSSLSMMNWGYYFTKVYTLGYLNWLFDHKNVIPTKQGLKKASETYINTAEHVELVGDYFPVIDLSVQVSQGWADLMGLKQELSNEDVFVLLSMITEDLYYDHQFKQGNIARLGLIYNLILDRLTKMEDRRVIEILAKEWCIDHKLPATNLSLVEPSHLIYVAIDQIEINEGSKLTLLLPRNLNKENRNIEELLALFSITKVNDIEYKQENAVEDLRVKQYVVQLLPFITFQKVKKLVIKHTEKYMNEMVIKLRNTSFYTCEQIISHLHIDDQTIPGHELKYLYDFEHNKVYHTGSYTSAKFRLDFSSILVNLFDAKKISNELLFGLGLKENDRLELMREDDHENLLESLIHHKGYLELLEELENKNQPQRLEPLMNAVITPSEVEAQGAIEIESQKEEVEEEKTFKSEYFVSEIELSEFNAFFNLDLDVTDKADWSAVAIFKAIKYYESLGFSIDHLMHQSAKILKEKYFEIVTDEEVLKIYPRSARQNLLFVSISLWESLEDENTILFMLLGDHKHQTISTKEQLLEGDKNLLFKLRGETTESRVDIVDRIFEDHINDLKYDEDGNAVLVVRINTEEKKFASLFDDFDF